MARQVLGPEAQLGKLQPCSAGPVFCWGKPFSWFSKAPWVPLLPPSVQHPIFPALSLPLGDSGGMPRHQPAERTNSQAPWAACLGLGPSSLAYQLTWRESESAVPPFPPLHNRGSNSMHRMG